MPNLGSDLRFVMRTLKAQPLFMAVAVVSLALGIGANTAIFSLIESSLLRSLPFRQADRLAFLSDHQPCCEIASLSPGEYLDTRSQTRTFTDIAAMAWQNVTLTGIAEPQSLRGRAVTANFFEVLGAHPEVGRLLSSQIDQPNANARAAVISDSLWRSVFGSDPKIVGRDITLNNKPFKVVGVLAPHEEYPPKIQVWISPRTVVPEYQETGAPPSDIAQIYGSHWMMGLGRIKEGIPLARAAAELRAIGERISRVQKRGEVHYPKMVPLQGTLVEQVRPALGILSVAVFVLLLIGCANIAGLMLARSVGRTREISIRIALGASRSGILRLLLLEAGVLAGMGCVLGIAFAEAGLVLLKRYSPYELPSALAPELNAWVLLFCVAISLLAALVVGIIPGLQTLRVDVQGGLKESSKGSASGRTLLLRRILVTGEIGLSVLLLIGALLLVRSFRRVLSVDPGFASEGVTTGTVSLPPQSYESDVKITQFWDRLLESARQLPGVESVAVSSATPMAGIGRGSDFEIEGHPTKNQANAPYADDVYVSGGLLQTLRIPLIAGRDLNEHDRKGNLPVLLINKAAADKLFPHRNPIGKRIRAGDQSPWETIVGVTGNVKWNGLDADAGMQVYRAYPQVEDVLGAALIVRTRPGSSISLTNFQGAVQSADHNVPVSEFKSLGGAVDESLGQRRFLLGLLTAFSALAIVLAAIGLYAVLAFTVEQRRREIGIRVAIGATNVDVIWLVLRDSLLMAVIGLAAGIGAACWSTALLKSLLFGISQTDFSTYAVAAVMMGAVALAASSIPVARAARTDPALALRYE
jgi:putative ABC transport system permease protein